MKIESISDITKDRKKIVFDSGEVIVLYKGELRLLKLKEGSEVSDEQYTHIVNVVLVKRAKLRSLNLLKTRAYTEYQLRKKLKDGLYPSSVIDAAVEYVKSYGYINDKQYALDYTSELKARLSRKEIYQKLVQKGIDKPVIENAFLDIFNSDDGTGEESFDERNVIEKLLKKRGYTGNESYEDRQKLLAYFYRRGFSMDAVFKAMDLHNMED